VVMTSNKLK